MAHSRGCQISPKADDGKNARIGEWLLYGASPHRHSCARNGHSRICSISGIHRKLRIFVEIVYISSWSKKYRIKIIKLNHSVKYTGMIIASLS